jgi:predicted ATPase
MQNQDRLNKLKRVEIEGFRKEHFVRIDFDEKQNFIVGYNGTGKTTIINLLRSCLCGDATAISKAHFKSIKLFFYGENSVPYIEYSKETGDFGVPYICFKYYEYSSHQDPVAIIRFKADGWTSKDRFEYDFDEFEEDERDISFKQIMPILENLTSVTWLSIHRADPSSSRKFRNRQHPVDQKIADIIHRMTQYFSSLDNAYSTIRDNFTHKYFVALLQREEFRPENLKNLDQTSEEETLQKILKSLGVPETNYKDLLRSHFSQLASVPPELPQTMDVNHAITIANALRLHAIVEEWKSVEEKRQDIFRVREAFQKIINRLYLKKRMNYDVRNLPKFRTEKDEPIAISDLSSGEKQIFILLGEAMLQEERAVIYMADEPELSLHLEWQLELVRSIHMLNPNAQVIFATHSPDIVGPHKSSVISMTDLF